MADPKPLYRYARIHLLKYTHVTHERYTHFTPTHLLSPREIVELERQLRELLRANPLNAQDANALRTRYVITSALSAATRAPAHVIMLPGW